MTRWSKQPAGVPREAAPSGRPGGAADASVIAIQVMLPGHPEELIRAVLEEHGGDPDAALEALLWAGAGEEPAPAAAPAAAAPPPTSTGRDFLGLEPEEPTPRPRDPVVRGPAARVRSEPDPMLNAPPKSAPARDALGDEPDEPEWSPPARPRPSDRGGRDEFEAVSPAASVPEEEAPPPWLPMLRKTAEKGAAAAPSPTAKLAPGRPTLYNYILPYDFLFDYILLYYIIF